MENTIETFRSLAQLEGEMKRAERDYVDADARFREAEIVFKDAERRFVTARHQRDLALDALNDCHADIDRTIEMLREASPIGCDWKTGIDSRGGVSIPSSDTMDFMLKD